MCLCPCRENRCSFLWKRISFLCYNTESMLQFLIKHYLVAFADNAIWLIPVLDFLFMSIFLYIKMNCHRGNKTPLYFRTLSVHDKMTIKAGKKYLLCTFWGANCHCAPYFEHKFWIMLKSFLFAITWDFEWKIVFKLNERENCSCCKR